MLGSPVVHSRSPAIHGAAYAELGLDWEYDAHDVTVEDLPAFLDSRDRSWRGLSLTMPLKRTVLPLLTAMSEEVRDSGAANTVVLEDGARVGHNTDIPGVVAALRERHDAAVDTATVVGGGATATSVLFALADLGCARVDLVVRSPDRAAATLAAVARHRHPPEVTLYSVADLVDGSLPVAPLLVSTVPAGAYTARALAACSGAEVVFDVVYDPWPTPLAASAVERGQLLVSGIDLLVHQALLQVELMTGRRPHLETLRHAAQPGPAG